ncbi:hypothetical protein AYX14_06264 [Cryptococcus neoformans]|nr:hypothetical protein AYX14_06264 [Cryptococcus neoformans var. grubii]
MSLRILARTLPSTNCFSQALPRLSRTPTIQYLFHPCCSLTNLPQVLIIDETGEIYAMNQIECHPS